MTPVTVKNKCQITDPKDNPQARPSHKKVSDVFGKYQRKEQLASSTADIDEAIKTYLQKGS